MARKRVIYQSEALFVSNTGNNSAAVQLHRIQSAVLDNNPKLERFARFLGFTPEGVLRRYGTDRTDYTLYSRLFHG